MLRDLKNNHLETTSIGPAAYTADADGAGVDMQGFDSLMFLFIVGTITDGTHTPKLQESDDDITYTDVGADDIEGTLAALASDTNQRVGYKGNKRYVKAFVTVAGATTGGVYAAAGVQGHAHAKPVS